MSDILSDKAFNGIHWELVKPNENILTQTEAIKLLKVSPKEIVRLRKKNEIPYKIHRGCYFYQKTDCIDWILKNQTRRLKKL